MNVKCDEVEEIFAEESDHKAQIEALAKLCDKYLPTDAKDVDGDKILKYIDSVIAIETGSMVVSRQFVSMITDRLETSNLPADRIRQIAEGILKIVKTRTISYEEQVSILRLILAGIYEKTGELKEAANMLIAVISDGAAKFSGPTGATDRAKLLIRISRLLLECNEVDEAEHYVNRASLSMIEVNSWEVKVEHKALQARVTDAKRRFIEAAQRYYELSNSDDVSMSDKIKAFEMATVCVVLAKPGKFRNRLLHTIYKDERALKLPSYDVISKMCLNRLIHNNELAEFEKRLAPHQQIDENGESIIKDVIQEHNITAISRLYSNITMGTLGCLLNIDPEAAELLVGEMIASERVNGYIDQTDGVLHFEERHEISTWDSQVASTLEQVNTLCNVILLKHPELTDVMSEAC